LAKVRGRGTRTAVKGKKERGIADHFETFQIALVVIFMLLIVLAVYFLLTGNIPGLT